MSITMPSSSEISVGVPHPSFPIGATTTWSCAIGKNACRSLTIRVMFPTTSGGKRTLFTEPVRTPWRRASVSSERLSASSPPTPISVKPNPSCTGVNSAVTRIRSAKPLLPSGSFVLMIATAFSETTPSNESSSAAEVLALVDVDVQEPAARDWSCVDAQADGRRAA